jgi:hypothetical protein
MSAERMQAMRFLLLALVVVSILSRGVVAQEDKNKIGPNLS